mmetsp:Transcript_1657/g.4209  ORF Transcript_1657/g.4209 Transcript_1657/m.4209 type:complete len:98 (+) Transcript_1657:383-676(+)
MALVPPRTTAASPGTSNRDNEVASLGKLRNVKRRLLWTSLRATAESHTVLGALSTLSSAAAVAAICLGVFERSVPVTLPSAISASLLDVVGKPEEVD